MGNVKQALSILLCLIMLVVVVMVAGPAAAVEQSTEEWVARYNGPGNGHDVPFAIAVDPSSGNAYVTGASYGGVTDYDYATVAYDSSSDELWVARYNGPGNGMDWADDIAIDSSGNVYVTGSSIGSGTGSDYATIAYDPSGNEQWVARYNGPANSGDSASAIAVDTSGNVYVTGTSCGDYTTVAYDPSGNELWVARYDGPGDGDDRSSDMTIDTFGNVYVTGYSYGSDTDWDFATVAYDSSGNELWAAGYNGPGNGMDMVHGIAVDSSGHVYVTGPSDGIGSGLSGLDYVTIAYDSSGNELWVARYNGPGNAFDASMAIGTAFGNIYVSGLSNGGGTERDYATIAYDSDGNELWVRRYNGPGNGPDGSLDMTVDPLGNVYVTGWSEGSGTGQDMATVAYDSDGNELWVARYDGGGNDYGDAITTVLLGNVYVVGRSDGIGTGMDYATLKYISPSPTPGEALTDLAALVTSLDLPAGLENALVSKLNAAIESLGRGQPEAALGQLGAFVNQVQAQRGKKIPEDDADMLVELAEAIIASIQSGA